MKCFKSIFLCFVLAMANSIAYGEAGKEFYWQPLLEIAFNRTFSSSHEFSACQAFQKLGYDLAEIAQIKRITPYPASLSVKLQGLSEESERDIGLLSLETLDIHCTKVHYFGMIFDRVTFRFIKAAIERKELEKGKLRFHKLDKIGLCIEVSEKDILSVIKMYPKSSLLSNLKITLNSNKCKCKGRVKLGFMVADFSLKGYTKQISLKKVNFICEKLYINGISQPRAFIKAVMSYVNPVFDSSKVWINLNVANIRIKNGFVETEASIEKKELKNAY